MAVALACAPGCGDDDGSKEPIRIGLLAPKSGRAAAVGNSFDRVAKAAARALNSAGGIDGREVVLVIRDTESEPATAELQMRDLIDAGVVAVVGPALSDSVVEVVPIAAAEKIPLISPSSTAVLPALDNDDGYLFRNTPNDKFQGAAQAHYLARVSYPGKPLVDRAAVVYENSTYGDGLQSSFVAAFERACATCVMIPESDIIRYDSGLSNTAASDVIDKLSNIDPPVEWVMVVTIDVDGVTLMNAWDPSDGDPILPNVKWLMTDGARVETFVDRVPGSMEGMRGTAPTNPTTGEAFGVLAAAYEAENLEPFDEQVFAANVWDAYYLIAAALAQQIHDGTELGGPALRDAIMNVSAGPGQIFHAGQWTDLQAAILAGNEVDYDGASGPNDFDDAGETLGPYEIWRIQRQGDGTGLEFAQERILDPSEFDDLTEN